MEKVPELRIMVESINLHMASRKKKDRDLG
jgi:hypothetical protein